MKCYSASFNVGNMEVWSSDLFFHKKDVIEDIEMSLDEIAYELSETLYLHLSENETNEILVAAIKSLRRNGVYKNKDNNFDFFILEQYIWKNIKEREIYTEKIKIDEYYGTN